MNLSSANAETCKAAIFDAANKPLRLENVQIPTPGPGEILVKIDACTVCGSDLHTMTGARNEKTPTILGHEIIGTVASTGSARIFDAKKSPLSIGDRVTWSVCLSCGKCERCQRGFPQKCLQLKKVGHETFESNTDLVGGFSELILLPNTMGVFKINSNTPDDLICPANCATATTMAAFRNVEQIDGRSILIIGAGLLGLTASAYAKSKGAAEIVVLEPDETRRKVASDFGCTSSYSDSSAFSPDTKFDIIMDYSGVASAIESAIPFSQLGCQIVLVGSVLPSPDIEIDPEFVVRNLISLHGVHNYTPVDLERAIEFLELHGSSFPFGSLVAKSFPLEKINEAIDYALDHKPIRVMIRP